MEKGPTREDPLLAPNTWYTFYLLGVGFWYERLFRNFDPSCWVVFLEARKTELLAEGRGEKEGGGGEGGGRRVRGRERKNAFRQSL